jgi:hypothetical protein
MWPKETNQSEIKWQYLKEFWLKQEIIQITGYILSFDFYLDIFVIAHSIYCYLLCC